MSNIINKNNVCINFKYIRSERDKTYYEVKLNNSISLGFMTKIWHYDFDQYIFKGCNPDFIQYSNSIYLTYIVRAISVWIKENIFDKDKIIKLKDNNSYIIESYRDICGNNIIPLIGSGIDIRVKDEENKDL